MLRNPDNLNPSNVSIKIVQNPKIARMSGVRERNTLRLLDPPLILELEVVGKYSKPRLEAIGKKYVCQLSLRDDEFGDNCDYFTEVANTQDTKFRQVDNQIYPAKTLHNLIGNTVSTATTLRAGEDYDTPWRLFFVFPHLSVRLAGRYYLLCVVSKLDG